MPATRSLYEIGEEAHVLRRALEDMDFTPEQIDAALDEWLNSNEELEVKLSNYCKYMRMLQFASEDEAEEGARFMALAKSDSGKLARMKEHLRFWLDENTPDGKARTRSFRLWTQQNGGPPPAPVVKQGREAELPASLMRMTLSITLPPGQMSMLLDMLNEGIVPEQDDFFHTAVRSIADEVGAVLHQTQMFPDPTALACWIEERVAEWRLACVRADAKEEEHPPFPDLPAVLPERGRHLRIL